MIMSSFLLSLFSFLFFSLSEHLKLRLAPEACTRLHEKNASDGNELVQSGHYRKNHGHYRKNHGALS